MKKLKSQWGKQMTKEALKLALEALEGVLDNSPKVLDASISGGLYEVIQCRDAITAIKEALAQPEQHQDWCASLTQMLMSMPPKPAPCNCKPLQRTWVGLTDEEIDIAWRSVDHTIPYAQFRIDVAKAIEAKLKEKNNG